MGWKGRVGKAKGAFSPNHRRVVRYIFFFCNTNYFYCLYTAFSCFYRVPRLFPSCKSFSLVCKRRTKNIFRKISPGHSKAITFLHYRPKYIVNGLPLSSKTEPRSSSTTHTTHTRDVSSLCCFITPVNFTTYVIISRITNNVFRLKIRLVFLIESFYLFFNDTELKFTGHVYTTAVYVDFFTLPPHNRIQIYLKRQFHPRDLLYLETNKFYILNSHIIFFIQYY